MSNCFMASVFLAPLWFAQVLGAQELPEFDDEDFAIMQLLPSTHDDGLRALVTSNDRDFVCEMGLGDGYSNFHFRYCMPIVTKAEDRAYSVVVAANRLEAEIAAEAALAAANAEAEKAKAIAAAEAEKAKAIAAVEAAKAKGFDEAAQVRTIENLEKTDDAAFEVALIAALRSNKCELNVGNPSFEDAHFLEVVLGQLMEDYAISDAINEVVRSRSLRAFGRLYRAKLVHLADKGKKIVLEDCN